MAAVYFIFFAEVAAYRIGTQRLEKLGIAYSESGSSALASSLTSRFAQ
jgi:zinc transporter 1/2/3